MRLFAVLALALSLASCGEGPAGPQKEQPKPELHLLTALPLVWAEEFGLYQPDEPAIKELAKHYRIKPIDLPSELPEGGLLLAAQPRALPAEELVALDAWVRRGGRLLLLADPRLEWPTHLPLGDLRRAPYSFPDTGLLGHWGLRLDAPDEGGSEVVELGSTPLLTRAPGTLVRSTGSCALANSGLVARCAIGMGQATVIADADFLNVNKGGIAGPTGNNLPALVSELDSLSR